MRRRRILHSVPKGTFEPLHGPCAAQRQQPECKLIYSRAPKYMGMGRPAQNVAGQP